MPPGTLSNSGWHGVKNPPNRVSGWIFYVGRQVDVVDSFPKVDEAQPFAINNTLADLYRCGNDAPFSSISFQFQR
jgi:hypothetical protein